MSGLSERAYGIRPEVEWGDAEFRDGRAWSDGDDENYAERDGDYEVHVPRLTGGRRKALRGRVSKRQSESSAALPSHNQPWTEDEHQLFLEGLSLYGQGNWKAISQHVRSRNGLQVKNHARFYFKKLQQGGDPGEKRRSGHRDVRNRTNMAAFDANGGDSDGVIEGEAARLRRRVPAGPRRDGGAGSDMDYEAQGASSAPPSSSPPRASRAAAVTAASSSAEPAHVRGRDVWRERLAEENDRGPTGRNDSAPARMEISARGRFYGRQAMSEAEDDDDGDPRRTWSQAQLGSPNVHSGGWGDRAAAREPREAGGRRRDGVDYDTLLDDIPPPTREVLLDLATVTPHEKAHCPEFFGAGNPTKTPERYVTIRARIIGVWNQKKPRYVGKTAIRPLLRDCGDVNAIGRVHTYLERIGAINYGATNIPRNVQRGPAEARGRKRRASVDLDLTLNGKRRRRGADDWDRIPSDPRERKYRPSPPVEAPRQRYEEAELGFAEPERPRRGRSMPPDPFHPFTLVPCAPYGGDRPAPFHVNVVSNALVVMDTHAHLATTEIIGLVGGRYDPVTRILEITEATPCRSVSTGLQCEMDPASEMEAREAFERVGLKAVGWYHSHPTFAPNPSVRDIENQACYQRIFAHADGAEPFVGIIVSPYDDRNPSYESCINSVHISYDWDPSGAYRMPYAIPLQVVYSTVLPSTLLAQIAALIRTYSIYQYRQTMQRPFRKQDSVTCLDKMLLSIGAHLRVEPTVRAAFLERIRRLVLRATLGAADLLDGLTTHTIATAKPPTMSHTLEGIPPTAFDGTGPAAVGAATPSVSAPTISLPSDDDLKIHFGSPSLCDDGPLGGGGSLSIQMLPSPPALADMNASPTAGGSGGGADPLLPASPAGLSATVGAMSDAELAALLENSPFYVMEPHSHSSIAGILANPFAAGGPGPSLTMGASNSMPLTSATSQSQTFSYQAPALAAPAPQSDVDPFFREYTRAPTVADFRGMASAAGSGFGHSVPGFHSTAPAPAGGFGGGGYANGGFRSRDDFGLASGPPAGPGGSGGTVGGGFGGFGGGGGGGHDVGGHAGGGGGSAYSSPTHWDAAAPRDWRSSTPASSHGGHPGSGRRFSGSRMAHKARARPVSSHWPDRPPIATLMGSPGSPASYRSSVGSPMGAGGGYFAAAAAAVGTDAPLDALSAPMSPLNAVTVSLAQLNRADWQDDIDSMLAAEPMSMDGFR